MPKSKAQLQAEEDALIKMFSSDVGSKSNAGFFMHGLLAAATPLFVFIRIQQVDVVSAWHVLTLFTAVTAYVLQFTYKKAKFNLKHKLASQIHSGISKEVMGSLSEKDKKGMSAQEKNDKILRRKNDIADRGSMQQAIFQTNIVYFCLVLVASFFIFGNWEPLPNYLGSMILSVGFIGVVAAMEK